MTSRDTGQTAPQDTVTPDVRPDLHEAVIEAVGVAAERGMPLAADAVAAAQADSSAQQMLHAAVPSLPRVPVPRLPNAPWMGMVPELLEGVRQVNIMESLAGLVPRMTGVEREIERLITSPVKLIADIASHTLSAGGKRLRPALTLLSAQLCGDGDGEPAPRVVTCAALIELTHTTTLLHDDVVDEAETRRGKPTANLLWGNETSVLVGDFLFAQVFVTASQREFFDLMYPLAHATAQMCAGELLETQTRGLLEMTEKQYQDIIALKTASLTDCACRLGAQAMNAPEELVERLSRYGRDIGMAFQIVDDVFDIVSSEGRIGKPVGNDIREGDITLPMLRAMQVVSEAEKAELRAVMSKSLAGGEISSGEVERALDIIRGCDAVAHSFELARGFIASAKNQLEAFEPSPARSMLNDIADYVMSRDK